MINLSKIKKAINFATKTHEIDQKQKRKGKDIPYIVHPLTVGLILAYAGAKEDIVCAGILHDTVEDSIEEKKVSIEMIQNNFGKNVADLVLAVTEIDKSLPWEERKRLAKEHIKDFSNDKVLVKSADIIANTRDLIEDYNKNGNQVFEKFNASKDKTLNNYIETIDVLINQWTENPFTDELHFVSNELMKIK